MKQAEQVPVPVWICFLLPAHASKHFHLSCFDMQDDAMEGRLDVAPVQAAMSQPHGNHTAGGG